MPNVFANCYQQPENKLTYCFFCLLEHLNPSVRQELLRSFGFDDLPPALEFGLLQGGKGSKPDGRITLQRAGSLSSIFFENKTWRRVLDAGEIRNHLRDCVKGSDSLLVITADQFGRPPKPQVASSQVLALEAKAAELSLQASAPQPILMGRHLIDLGMMPGREFGAILHAAFEAQLEGKFFAVDQAWRWLAEQPDLRLTEKARQALLGKISNQ